MPATIEIDVRVGVVIIRSPETGQVQTINRGETGVVTVELQDTIIPGDAPDCEAPDAPWEPLHEARSVTNEPIPMRLHETDEAIFKNSLYTVIRSQWHYPGTEDDPESPTLIHLSIRRNDRSPVTDWRHKQKIKNELAGEDCEAVELYPAEDRMVDTSNQFHLWCFPPGMRIPVGYEDGRVTCGTPLLGKAKQRPFVDGEHESVTPEKLEEMAQEYKAAQQAKAEDQT